jgi:hypothetical protein
MGSVNVVSADCVEMVTEGKDPPEGAQDGAVAPAISRTAAANGTDALDKPADDGEQQIQAGRVTGHPS